MEFNHEFERVISTPRVDTYRSQASSDDHAWALYRWNIELSAEVASLAAGLEVALQCATPSPAASSPAAKTSSVRLTLRSALRQNAKVTWAPLYGGASRFRSE